MQPKKWCYSHQFFQVFFSVTQFFLIVFSWNSNNITASNSKNTCVSEITIEYLHQTIIIPLLCQYRLFIHTCVSKSVIVSQDVIFYLFWYNVIRWRSHMYKNCLFCQSIICYFLVNNTRGVIEQNRLSVTQVNEMKNAILSEWPHG